MEEILIISVLAWVILIPLIIYSLIHSLKKQNENKQNEKRKEIEDALVKFYILCNKNGATNFSSAKSKQKAELIAQELGIEGYSDLASLYEEAKAIAVEREEIVAQEKYDKVYAKEKSEYEELTKYAFLEGREKRIAMLTDLQTSYYEEAQSLKDGSLSMIKMSQEKEKDWALWGGIASGLAGGAAGLATAMDIQEQNAHIRAKNADNLNALKPMVIASLDAEMEYRKKAEELQEYINDARIKLVSDMDADDVMEYLSFDNLSISVTETGNFIVQVDVELKEPFTIFDDVPAVVDGTLQITLYQHDEEVGYALLVLPAFGIGEKATLKGIGLGNGNVDPKVKGTPEVAPHLLWAMEA